MSTARRFVDLPHELLIKILCNPELDAAIDLRSCSKVCRLLNDIIRNTPSLMYLVELALAGLKDGPPGGPSFADRVTSLRQYRDAMETSQLPHRVLRLGGSLDLSRYHFWIGGAIVFRMRDADGCFEIHRPASFFSGLVQKVWHVDTRPIVNYTTVERRHFPNSISFAANVGQDLFVITAPACHYHNGQVTDPNSSPRSILNTFLSGSVRDLDHYHPVCHLLSISRGGLPHPVAAQAKLDTLLYDGGMDFRFYEDSVRFAGDLLVWMIWQDSSMFTFVFNWKTGECVWHKRGRCGRYSATFEVKSYLLGPSHLLEVAEEQLIVYRIAGAGQGGGPLVLNLPQIADGYRTWRDKTAPRAQSFSDCSPTFEEDPDLTNLVITFRIRRDTAETIRGAVFIIPLSNLVDLATRIERSATPGQDRHRLEWNEWGPDNARVVVVSPAKFAVSSMGGPRVSIAVKADDTDPVADVYTLDVRPTRRAPSRHTFGGYGGPESVAWIADCYGVEDAPMFKEPVRSTVPYRLMRQQVALGDPANLLPHLYYDGLVSLEYPPEG